jgi:CubicO group peptidase (beta-lactamase class C family)
MDEVTARPGREFFYNTGALMLVSAIMRKATGRPLDEFARATLFEPLGITAASLRAAVGTTVSSFRRRGSKPRRH